MYSSITFMATSLFFSFLFCFACAGYTEIHSATLEPGTVTYQRFGAFSVDDSPFGGSEPAYIQYDLAFTKTKGTNETMRNAPLGEVLVFFSDVRSHVGKGGGFLLDSREYCCDPTEYMANKCDKMGVILAVPTEPALNDFKLFYNHTILDDYSSTPTVHLSKRIELESTGIWYFFILNCDGQDVNGVTLSVSGTVTWKNPYGYVPGQTLGDLPLFWIMSAGYLIIGLAWIISALVYRKDLVKLQHAITFVILVSFIESTLRASNFLIWNFTGNLLEVTNILSALFTALKLTSVRTLMLIVAIGYTITRPFLSRGYKIGITGLALVYFGVEAVNEYSTIASDAGKPIPQMFLYIALIILLAANTAFFGWIGFEMYFTVRRLKVSEGEKFGMYKRLAIILALSITLSIVIIVFQMVIDILDKADDNFRVWWLFNSYWEFIYFACIAFVAWVWRPSAKNTRYAYTELHETKDDQNVDMTDINTQLDDSDRSAPVPKRNKVGASSHSVSSESSSSEDEEEKKGF